MQARLSRVLIAAAKAAPHIPGGPNHSAASRLALAPLLSSVAPYRAPLHSSAARRASIGMASLEESRIIPDLVDRVSEASQAELEVSFHGRPLKDGELIAPKDAASTPAAHIKGGTEGGLFTLICSDPDPPDPANPIRKEWLHWLVTNIPAASDVSKGNTVTSYMGPAPPIGTHRYAFMLFQQPNQEPLQAEDPSGGEMGKRAHFSTKKFAAAHNLGDPVAVTWFNAHK